MNNEKDRLSQQLIKLGDMMGDGLHHEDPWISREYKGVFKALHSEMFPKKKRKPSQVLIRTLKPCNCGAKGWVFVRFSGGKVGIKCKNCQCATKECNSNTEARDKWNTIVH